MSLPLKRWCHECNFMRRIGECDHRLVVVPDCVGTWARVSSMEDCDLGKMVAIVAGKVRYDSDWSEIVPPYKKIKTSSLYGKSGVSDASSPFPRSRDALSDEDLERMAKCS